MDNKGVGQLGDRKWLALVLAEVKVVEQEVEQKNGTSAAAQEVARQWD